MPEKLNNINVKQPNLGDVQQKAAGLVPVASVIFKLSGTSARVGPGVEA